MSEESIPNTPCPPGQTDHPPLFHLLPLRPRSSHPWTVTPSVTPPGQQQVQDDQPVGASKVSPYQSSARGARGSWRRGNGAGGAATWEPWARPTRRGRNGALGSPFEIRIEEAEPHAPARNIAISAVPSLFLSVSRWCQNPPSSTPSNMSNALALGHLPQPQLPSLSQMVPAVSSHFVSTAAAGPQTWRPSPSKRCRFGSLPLSLGSARFRRIRLGVHFRSLGNPAASHTVDFGDRPVQNLSTRLGSLFIATVQNPIMLMISKSFGPTRMWEFNDLTGDTNEESC